MPSLLSRQPLQNGPGFISPRHLHLSPALIVFLLLCFAHGNAAGPTTAPDATRQEKEAEMSQFVARHFPRLDREGDDTLRIVDVNAAVEDHAVQGRDAAIVVVIRRHMLGKSDERYLPRKQLLELANDQEFQNSIEATNKHLEKIDHDLFLPEDPELSTFHQGRIGDCYLLATIAAVVHRNPQMIRTMIQPRENGGFEVDFGNGQRVKVPPLTDAELLVGARMGSKHGIWLAVLEKACGLLREGKIARKTGMQFNRRTTVPSVVLTTGGSATVPIALFSGHHAKRLAGLGKTTKMSQIDYLLTGLMNKRRLTCASSRDQTDLPPGITPKHSYAVFGYDGARKQVKLFNPHGENFEPKGDPGWENGYLTEHGVLTLPLRDFFRIFHALDYETD